MPINPATCDAILSPAFVRAATRARQWRARVVTAFTMAGTAIVLVGLLAIPVFLIGSLQPWVGVPSGAWQQLGVLCAGSLRAAACAVLVAVPLGIATAMFCAHFSAPRLRAWMKAGLEVLDTLPTVVLGLVAAATLAPWLKNQVATVLATIVVLPALLLAAGFAFGARARIVAWAPLWLMPFVLAVVASCIAIGARHDGVSIVPSSPWNAMLVGLALGFAAMPMVFSIAEDALFLVPRSQTQAAFALGATRWQALVSVLLPAAGSGLIAASLLGISRCLGETMIVLMASGNTPIGGFDPLTGLRSISAGLALGMPDAAPASGAYRGLLLAALALLGMTVLLSTIANAVRERLRRRLSVDTHAR